MRAAVVTCAAFLVFLTAADSRASGSIEAPSGASKAATSIVPSVFQTVRMEVAPAAELSLRGSARLAGARIDIPAIHATSPFEGGSGAAGVASWGKKNTAIAIISSAILPGLGELYCYRRSHDRWTLARAPLFMALDGYLWYGYFHNHSEGKDYKQDYMDYADAHWSLDQFLLEHPCCEDYGGCDDWQFYNANCQGQFHYFYYTPIEVDEEEYYENIGKYNAFVYGWDDWDFQPDYWTPHREYYWGLRKESDKYLQRADNHLMGLIINRVVSMIDTAWLAYRISQGEDPDKGWSLRFKTFDEAPSLIISRRF